MSDARHQQFLELLKGSSVAEFVMAYWFHGRGWDHSMHGRRMAPSRDVAKEYSDQGDLTIEKDGVRKLISVKGLLDNSKNRFTCREDWPHPSVLVAKVSEVERLPDVSAYFMLNPDLTHAVMVDTKETRPSWFLRKIRPSNLDYEVEQECYACPNELARFLDLWK